MYLLKEVYLRKMLVGTSPKHPKGVSDEDENSFYKLRDWTKVSY